MMVTDAEGGTKVIETKVHGARLAGDARKAAREIVSSIGVKTAIYGEDAELGPHPGRDRQQRRDVRHGEDCACTS